tara:strand:- start:4552 stop:5439 length:888 start_codon:yes stop_codon:yes gene_type:complete
MPELPKYPIYIPTKGRWETPFTIRAFQKDEVPIYVVVQPQELEEYEKHCSSPTTTFLTLPFSNPVDKEGNPCGLLSTRNWIMDHSLELGATRHWQFDDNQDKFLRYYKGRSIPIQSHIALRIVEDFTDRYKNVAVSGFDYEMFVVRGKQTKPFTRNCRVYSASLINNEANIRWRLRYNDDVDICLQALATGYWSTILFRAVHIRKRKTMTVKGGNTDDLYQDDGRNTMARSLERVWPGVVETKRRFSRPQHVVSHSWKHFDNPLIPVDKPKPIPEYSMKIEGTPESKSLRNALDL